MENNFQFASAAISDRGLSEKRPQNEDSYLELREHGLFIVADGVGGAQAGDVASQMAVEILAEAFTNMSVNGDAEDVMKLGIEKANAAIFQMSHDLPQLSTMATTIVALHLSGNIATIGHVGDSRLYRLDGNGNLFRETQDHSVVEEEVRAGRMTAAQAASHPSRNVISRALGAEQAVEVDMKTIMFEPNTSFLLCSDGITRHIDDYQIREILVANDDATEICRLMKEICYERGAEDNLTAVVVKILPNAARKPSSGKGVAAALSDSDEPTVATARVPMFSSAVLPLNEAAVSESSTKDLNSIVPPLNRSDGDPETDASINRIAPTEDFNNNLPKNVFTTPAVSADNFQDDRPAQIQDDRPAQTYKNTADAHIIVETDEKVYRVDGEKNGGLLGKLLSALALLLIGGIVGAGAYHFARQSVPAAVPQPVPQITEMKTQNIPFSAFEENRRNVDRNPQQFIAANAADPQDATDYYLLGRAYLLTAKYTDAKQSLTTAKNLLAQADEVNSKTLANEIAMSLAVINDPFALKAFEKDVLENNSSANSSTNANLPANR
jgi:protein phosphatase